MRSMVFARGGVALPMCLAGCVALSPLGSADEGTGDGSGGSGSDDGHSSAPGDDSGDSADGGTDDGDPPVDGPPRIDFLFVIDNSGSMGSSQAALAGGLDALVTNLEAQENLSYRIGITTTDAGNPYCGTTGAEEGRLQLSSCRSRQGEFIFTGTPPVDVSQEACLDICDLEDIPILPTTTETDLGLTARPWIEGGAEGTNLDGVSVADALRCAMPQGVAGCGFESTLESAYLSLLRSQSAADENYGFMRSDAHLVIIFITDEVDCSNNDDFQSIFLPANQGGDPDVFWEDPAAGSPTSAVCWNAGVSCTGGPGSYDECHAVNKDVDGNVGVADEQAVMHPVARYRDFLLQIEQVKRETANASVFLFGIAGVPVGYPQTPIVFQDADDLPEQTDFGIGTSCTNETDQRASPPLRLLELAETFDNPVSTNMFSICGDIAGTLQPILTSVLAHIE
jgi:hypothetical protein